MEKTYEELITELQAIIRKIEDGDASLEESIVLYEQGSVLIRKCESMLEQTEIKVNLIDQES